MIILKMKVNINLTTKCMLLSIYFSNITFDDPSFAQALNVHQNFKL